MLVTLLLGFICLIINCIAYLQKSDWGLKLSFFFIFIFLGLRYNFGNDYEAYIELFQRIKFDRELLFDKEFYIFFEPGWLFLNWLFIPLGFFGLVIFTSFAYSYVFYRLIKDNLPIKYYPFAVSLLIFNNGFLLIHSSTMRQTIAIILFIFSLKYLLQKKKWTFIFFIIFASFFHFSAILILFTIPFLMNSKKVNSKMSNLIIISYVLLFFVGSYFFNIINYYLIQFFNKYGSYSVEGKIASGIGFIYYLIILFFILRQITIQSERRVIYFKVSILYILLLPIVIVVEMTSRMGMYFAPALIIAYPMIYDTLKNKLVKFILLINIISFTLIQFFQFFYSDTYKNYFMDYNSILTLNQWF
jgi:transmembrane protein EpsG